MTTAYPFAMTMPFTSGRKPSAPSPGAPAYWFVFQGDKMLIRSDRNTALIPLCPADAPPAGCAAGSYLGTFGETACYAAEMPPDGGEPPGFELLALRALMLLLPDDLFAVAGRARQFLHWHATHRFCGACGSTLVESGEEPAKHCPHCAQIFYPRLSPVVIMSVLDGDRILLARSPRFPAGMYSPLAGFVEPGETLEEAVMREVGEEVGLAVRTIRYVASQPWPFPHSLMVGFTSEYAGGTLRIDHRELEDARWFSRTGLPALPSRKSIARLLIERFLDAPG